jgi:hypothetical protein
MQKCQELVGFWNNSKSTKAARFINVIETKAICLTATIHTCESMMESFNFHHRVEMEH